MTRLLVPGTPLGLGEVVIPKQLARHAAVVRSKSGDALELLDLEGTIAVGRLVRWHKGACVVEVLHLERERGEPPGPLVLALAILHTEAFSWAVEKATELGATCIQPVICARVQGRDHCGRSDRWRRVAAAAVAQCGRSRPPEVREPAPLDEVVHGAVGFRLVADPQTGGEVAGSVAAAGGATVLVGPEGGFTSDEVEKLQKAGFAGLWLGPRTLRAETAAVAALTLAQRELGWLLRPHFSCQGEMSSRKS